MTQRLNPSDWDDIVVLTALPKHLSGTRAGVAPEPNDLPDPTGGDIADLSAIKAGDIVKIRRGGTTGGLDWEVLRIQDGYARVDLVRGSLLGPQWENLADLEPVRATLPDPTVTGPCQAQATFMCTGQAAGERLNPLAMLPNSTTPAGYVPMCQPCYNHLADAYVTAVHS